MRVHFVAVAGTGMGALAGLLRSAGHEVSGSDTSFYPPIGPALERWGVRLMEGFDPAHVADQPDLVVIGNVCRSSNVEARAAIDGGLRYASMAHALADLVLDGRSPLVVGGTHGKTTTSAMCAHVLSAVGMDPGYLIGGIPMSASESFRLPGPRKLTVQGGARGSSRKAPFVVEGDEYDTAFFEKTPKFWHYRPEVAIVTSIEHDHIDIYPTVESYLDAFRGFAARVPAGGLVVASAHDDLVAATVAETPAELAYYALSTDETRHPAHWMGAMASSGPAGTTFDVYAGGVYAGRAALRVPGEHNVRNALATLAACCQGFGADVKQAMAALETFEGVKRRQELRFEIGGVRVYDDFAHHPTAVKETLSALRAKHPTGSLWAVFEPRSATACRKIHQAAYATSFASATRVVFPPLGRPDIPEAERLDLGALTRALVERDILAVALPSVDDIVELIARDAARGDTVALLSNGAFGGIYEKLEAALAKR